MGPPLEPEADLANWVDEKNIHVSSFSGQKVQQLETNYNDSAFEKEALPIEKTTLSRGHEDVEVDITGCTKSSEPLIREDTCDDDDDATECSSSFGDTGSGREDASAFSDDEVTSYMYSKDPFSPMFYGNSEPGLRRRKKLTSHWESFIRPLTWRCKWLELKLKQLQSQERKYEKQLAAYEYRRQFVTENFSLDGFDTKSIPLPVGLCGKKVIKRKKRKRIEETCNLAAYTSDHRVLSYFEKKDRPADARLKNAISYLKNVKGVAEPAKNPESNEGLFKWNDDIFSHLENDSSSSLELNDTDKALFKMFERIEAAKYEVHKLRTRIDKVVHENLVKSSSVNYLNKQGLVPSNGLNPYNPNLASTFRIKESVEEHKSVSQAQASAPDLFAKNVVPNLLSNNLKDCSPSKSNVCGNKRRKRKKSGSNWGAGISVVKTNLRK